MNNARSLLLSALALASAGCGSPFFYADLDEPSVCKVVADVPFEPAVPGTDLRLAFEIPVGKYVPIFNTEDSKTTVFLNELSFTAKQGIADFNAVDSATITVLPQADSTLPALTVLSYTKDLANPPGKVLTVGGERDVELIPYLSADSDKNAKVEGVMKGALPANIWTADVKVCLHTKAHFNYARQYGL